MISFLISHRNHVMTPHLIETVQIFMQNRDSSDFYAELVKKVSLIITKYSPVHVRKSARQEHNIFAFLTFLLKHH